MLSKVEIENNIGLLRGSGIIVMRTYIEDLGDQKKLGLEILKQIEPEAYDIISKDFIEK